MDLAAIAYPTLDPVALRIGSLAIRWYGLAYVAGFVIAALVARWLIRRWSLALSDDDLLTIVFAAVIGVVAGARAGYVLIYDWRRILEDPLSVFAVWDGGMSFHGGLAGILVAGVVVARILRMPVLTLWDLGSVGAPAGILLGRLANFVNGELWGRVSDAPWAMAFPNAGPLPRHPSQLYEAFLEGAVLLFVMGLLASRKPPRPRGELIGWLLALYSVMRVVAEFFREPDAHLGFLVGGWVTMGMVLSVPMFVTGCALIVISQRLDLPELGRVPAGASD